MMNELNRETLKQAIKGLPDYQPGEGLWLQLEAVLPRAEETEFLSAPGGVWEKIDEELAYNETERNRNVLKQAIAALPVYEAPRLLWSGLLGMLEQHAAESERTLWRPVLNRVAAVAAILILFSGAMWIQASYEGPVEVEAEEAVISDVQIDSVELISAEESDTHEWEQIMQDLNPYFDAREKQQLSELLKSDSPQLKQSLRQWQILQQEVASAERENRQRQLIQQLRSLLP